MSDFNQFVASIPKLTKIFTISALTVAFLDSLNIFSSRNLMFNNSLILTHWEIWRAVTGFIVITPTFYGLMELYMFYTYSRGIEENKFFKNIADYSFYLFIILPLIIITNLLLNSHSSLPILIGSLTFTWSRVHRHKNVNIYFLPIKAIHLPVVTLGFKLLLEGPYAFIATLTGMAIAYFYSCIESKSLGPLYVYIVNTFGINVTRQRNTNRVGTIHTINETDVEGYLGAPDWFRKFIEKFTKDRNVRAGGVEGKRFNTFGDTVSGSTGVSSGVSTGEQRNAFRGKGFRLGE